MSITADIIRGHTDAIILSNLIKKDNYGYEINKSIKRSSDGEYELNEATLYTAFKRLQESGCITCYWGSEDTGARRKYYSITPHGIKVYKQKLEDWKTTKSIIDKLLETEEQK